MLDFALCTLGLMCHWAGEDARREEEFRYERETENMQKVMYSYMVEHSNREYLRNQKRKQAAKIDSNYMKFKPFKDLKEGIIFKYKDNQYTKISPSSAISMDGSCEMIQIENSEIVEFLGNI